MSDALRASTPPELALRGQARVRISGYVLLALVAVWAWLVWNAPSDVVQGPIQKILFVHAPCAFAAYLGFFLTAVYGGIYLFTGNEHHDRMAAAAAGVGVFFCTLMLVTGPIWARGTWGKWWTWDLRLTITLLLYLVYVAYLLLRSFTEGSERTARFAAVYGIAGLAVIPLNYFAIELSGGRAMHPENLERGSLGTGMSAPFWISVVTCLAAYLHLWLRRAEVLTLRAAVARQEAGEVP